MGVMFDIIGSILVRTAIVLIVLRMNVSLNTMMSETVAHATIQKELSILREVMAADFEYAGLNVAAGTGILDAQVGSIKFQGDLQSDGSIETIYYYYGGLGELLDTPNPSDRKFYRQINSETPLVVAHGLTKCVFTFYNASGSQTWDEAQIKSFSISMTMQDGRIVVESWKDGAQVLTYPSSYWEQTFYPWSL